MICVQHREWRSYTLPGGEKQSKFAPAYYHVNVLCIRRNWPAFNQSELTISTEVAQRLTNVSLGFCVQKNLLHCMVLFDVCHLQLILCSQFVFV